MNKSIAITGVIFGILIIIGIFFFARNTGPSTIEIKYYLGIPMNSGNETLTIYNNGTYIYESEFMGRSKNTISGQLSESDFNDVKELIKKADIFNLKDSYFCEMSKNNCMTDSAFHSLTINLDGKEKKIETDYSDIPDGLDKLLQKLRVIKETFSTPTG